MNRLNHINLIINIIILATNVITIVIFPQKFIYLNIINT